MAPSVGPYLACDVHTPHSSSCMVWTSFSEKECLNFFTSSDEASMHLPFLLQCQIRLRLSAALDEQYTKYSYLSILKGEYSSTYGQIYPPKAMLLNRPKILALSQ